MLEINIVVNTKDSSASIADGLIKDNFYKLVDVENKSKTSMVRSVVVAGFVHMNFLLAKEHVKELKIHQITEMIYSIDPKEEPVAKIIPRNNAGVYDISTIESLCVIEDILWEML